MAPVKGVIYGDDDFIQGRSGKLLGYDAQNNGLVARGDSAPQSLEEYLLKFQTNWLKRFLAKYFGQAMYVGYFKKIHHTGHDHWFLFWCGRCKQFKVNHREGYEQGLYCHCSRS